MRWLVRLLERLLLQSLPAPVPGIQIARFVEPTRGALDAIHLAECCAKIDAPFWANGREWRIVAILTDGPAVVIRGEPWPFPRS